MNENYNNENQTEQQTEISAPASENAVVSATDTNNKPTENPVSEYDYNNEKRIYDQQTQRNENQVNNENSNTQKQQIPHNPNYNGSMNNPQDNQKNYYQQNNNGYQQPINNQNNNYNTNGQYSNPNYYQNNQQNMYNKNEKKKNGDYLKKTVLIFIAAILFGVLSGAVAFGVKRTLDILVPLQLQTQTQTPVQNQMPTESNLEEKIRAEIAKQQIYNYQTNGVVIEDVSLIVEDVMPSVVAINNTSIYQGITWFGHVETYEVPSNGSGIIVGENETELLIVTNYHVIENAETLSVTFIDDETVNAAIKGTDVEADLAVVAVPLSELSTETRSKIKFARIGDSDALKMGQGVIAIGNALGHGQSVTVGHVSALDREITFDGVTRKVIQTDAAINPGNSGGALLNAKGELIGINEAKYADETVEGVGYAIPISYAIDIIEDLKLRTTKIEVKEEEQGCLGIQIQNIDATMSEMYGMPQGVFVYKILEGSAAADSELREKDIITKIEKERVKSNTHLVEMLTYYKVGTTVTLTVERLEDGKYVEKEIPVTLKSKEILENQDQNNNIDNK